ncbi:MAG TPA: hypothetical protein VMG10_05830 [Gemmataceae bacterium]|nr:hypothetical protein [Gemmataceae bacterium]
MPWFTFCRLFRSRWQRLTWLLWPDTLRERLQAELARLDGELAQRYQRLLKCRQKIEKIRFRLRERAIDRLHERLQKWERAYAERLSRFHHRKQQRAAVRAQLLSCPPPQSIRSVEESDFDYPF